MTPVKFFNCSSSFNGILSFILFNGRNVAIPTFFSFKRSIQRWAVKSESTTKLFSLAPATTSIAVEYFESTLPKEAIVPWTPVNLEFNIKLTAWFPNNESVIAIFLAFAEDNSCLVWSSFSLFESIWVRVTFKLLIKLSKEFWILSSSWDFFFTFGDDVFSISSLVCVISLFILSCSSVIVGFCSLKENILVCTCSISVSNLSRDDKSWILCCCLKFWIWDLIFCSCFFIDWPLLSRSIFLLFSSVILISISCLSFFNWETLWSIRLISWVRFSNLASSFNMSSLIFSISCCKLTCSISDFSSMFLFISSIWFFFSLIFSLTEVMSLPKELIWSWSFFILFSVSSFLLCFSLICKCKYVALFSLILDSSSLNFIAWSRSFLRFFICDSRSFKIKFASLNFWSTFSSSNNAFCFLSSYTEIPAISSIISLLSSGFISIKETISPWSIILWPLGSILAFESKSTTCCLVLFSSFILNNEFPDCFTILEIFTVSDAIGNSLFSFEK